MRLFLLGAPASGKTTLMSPLRSELDCPVLDMDEELRRVNSGAWPELDVKRGQTLDIMSELSLRKDVVLAYSLLDEAGLDLLRARQWSLVLLDLPESVMRRRAAERERIEAGPTSGGCRAIWPTSPGSARRASSIA